MRLRVGESALGRSTTSPRRHASSRASRNPTAITAGGGHSCALHADGTVSCWGSNGYGELGAAEPESSDSALPVSGLSDVRAISTGYGYTCALWTSPETLRYVAAAIARANSGTTQALNRRRR